MRRFYLGTHRPRWLERSDVPLFVSAVTLRSDCKRKRPRARTRWAKDSGGFSALNAHGRWTGSDAEYAAETIRDAEEIGNLDAAAIRDWMCEPFILAKTGKTVREHQMLTIESLANLRHLAPGVPWMPVLQGWHRDDYLAHLEMYAQAGFDLRDEPLVGVGSVCRRQGTREAIGIMRAISMRGIRIHAFGVKTSGLALYADWIESADSMAWSFTARRQRILLDECDRDPNVNHKNCANCFRFAMQWHDELIRGLAPSRPVEHVQEVMPW